MSKKLSVFILLVISFLSYSNEISEFKKNMILIFPFINKTKIEKYDYLKDTILNALNSELKGTDKFGFIDPSKLNVFIKSTDYFTYPSESIDFAHKLNVNIAVFGQFVIIDNQINIQINVIDVLSKQIIVCLNVNGKLGTDIFRVIDESVKDITEEITEGIEHLKTIDNKRIFNLNEKKTTENIVLSGMNISGLAVFSAGSVFSLAGLILLIYDFASYKDILIAKRDEYLNTEGMSNDEYLNSYDTFIGLFSAGLTCTIIGIIMLSIGIPLFVYKKKSMVMNFTLDNEKISFYIKYKL